MGLLWGWTELADHRVLSGIAREFELASDGDWCIKVAPTSDDEELLRNPRVGKPNTNMLVECEVEPPNRLHGRDAMDYDVMMSFLSPLINRPITVAGTWSVDKSHRYDGNSAACIFTECLDGKTEIHPITSIFHERDVANHSVRQFDFFVFCDDSENFPRRVPHSGESRIGSFRVSTPRNSTWFIREELDMARSKSFVVEEVAGTWSFAGSVESGTAGEGKGFYYALIDLHASDA